MDELAIRGLGPLVLTLKLAAVTVGCLLVVGTPIGWWLARARWRGKAVVEAIVALPIVLPPTVIGFYMLILLGPNGPVGRMWAVVAEGQLTFSFTGLVLASVVYSLPFVVQPIQNAFEAVGEAPLEAARVLRAGAIDRFATVALPLAAPGFLTAAVLGFAHTLGEFGVVLMVGGNIPGETRVVSIALYDHVETLDYAYAHWMSAILLAISFAVLLVVYVVNRRWLTAWR
ncbi:MAG: molybdate ABC transporter permease subunit [Alphaproteobacteria bacterium]